MTTSPSITPAKPETAASEPQASSVKSQASADSKKNVINDIRAKWGKFSEQELSAIKDRDDLVNQVAAKYSLDKAQALNDVNGVLKDRQI